MVLGQCPYPFVICLYIVDDLLLVASSCPFRDCSIVLLDKYIYIYIWEIISVVCMEFFLDSSADLNFIFILLPFALRLLKTIYIYGPLVDHSLFFSIFSWIYFHVHLLQFFFFFFCYWTKVLFREGKKNTFFSQSSILNEVVGSFLFK